MKKRHRYDYHHRLPQAQGGTDNYPEGNLVRVNAIRHAHWSALFKGDTPLDSIVEELNNVWIDPRYELILKRKGD